MSAAAGPPGRPGPTGGGGGGGLAAAPPPDSAPRAGPGGRLLRLGYRLAYLGLLASWRVRRPERRAAALAVRVAGDRVLCVRLSYRPGLALPGGLADGGETGAAAAAREAREEAGIEAPPAELVPAARVTVRRAGARIACEVFEWRPPGPPPAPRADGREVVWAGYLAPAELRGRALNEDLAAYLAARPAPGDGGKGVPGQGHDGTGRPAREGTP